MCKCSLKQPLQEDDFPWSTIDWWICLKMLLNPKKIFVKF